MNYMPLHACHACNGMLHACDFELKKYVILVMTITRPLHPAPFPLHACSVHVMDHLMNVTDGHFYYRPITSRM